MSAAGAARGFLVTVLAFTAGAKILNVEETRDYLRKSGFLPLEAVPVVAWGVPCVELLTAALLVIPRSVTVGACGALLLSVVFSAIHAYLIWHGIVLPCTCIGALSVVSASRASEVTMLLLSLIMMAAAMVVLFACPKAIPRASRATRGWRWAAP